MNVYDYLSLGTWVREVGYVGRQLLYDVIEATAMMTANSESSSSTRQ